MIRVPLNSLLALTVVCLLFSSCSKHTKLLAGRDYEKQYQEGVRMYEQKKDSKAIQLLNNVANIYAGTERADTIAFYRCMLAFRQREYLTSAEMFDLFRKMYGRSVFLPEAEYQYAMSYYMIAPNPERDQQYSMKAISAFSEFIYRYPKDQRVPEAKNYVTELTGRIYTKEYMVAETYYNIGYYISAVVTAKNILKRTPDIPQREDILYLITRSYYEYARGSVPSKQRERFFDVVDAYYSLIGEYPDSKYKKNATRMYNNAQAFIEGSAVVDESSQKIKAKRGDIYAQRAKLQREITDIEISGKKQAKLNRLKEKLEEVDKKIVERENREATETLIN